MYYKQQIIIPIGLLTRWLPQFILLVEYIFVLCIFYDDVIFLLSLYYILCYNNKNVVLLF